MLPDRILVYADDGDARARAVHERRAARRACSCGAALWRTCSCTSPAARWWSDDDAPRAPRVLEYYAPSYRRTWRGSVLSSFLRPVLFLLGMGIGLGPLVDSRHARARRSRTWTTSLPGCSPRRRCRSPWPSAMWPMMGAFKWTRGTTRCGPPRCGRSTSCAAAASCVAEPRAGRRRVLGGDAPSVRCRPGPCRAAVGPCSRPRCPGRSGLACDRQRQHVRPAVPVRDHPDDPVRRRVLPGGQLPPAARSSRIHAVWHGVELCRYAARSHRRRPCGPAVGLVGYLRAGRRRRAWATDESAVPLVARRSTGRPAPRGPPPSPGT